MSRGDSGKRVAGPRPAVRLYKAPGPRLSLVPQLPSLLELRSASTAAAMKCLLLALSVALVCGTQTRFIPRTTLQDLDVQKVWGEGAWQGGAWGGGCAAGGREAGPSAHRGGCGVRGLREVAGVALANHHGRGEGTGS